MVLCVVSGREVSDLSTAMNRRSMGDVAAGTQQYLLLAEQNEIAEQEFPLA